MDNQSGSAAAAPSPRAGSQCESARRLRRISRMFMLASSPIEKTAIQADISGKLPGNLRQTPVQGKRGSHPLAVSKEPFSYGNSGDVGNRVIGQWQADMPGPTRCSG